MKYLFTFLLVGWMVLPALAHQGTLQGVVYDAQTRKPLAGAVVTLPAVVPGISTNEAGAFKFRRLDPGAYEVTVSFVGYQTSTEKITIVDGETTSLSVYLRPGVVTLEEVKVFSANAHDQQLINAIDIGLRPVNNSQEVLRMVPGLFIGQHAGGGKAEQIFLRGFDLDHGTDIRLTVDGMPVNMVSHAHGQGYADLHFVIPELIENVHFKKGPYFADKGNFTTAGWVDFRTKERLERNVGKVEVGQFNTLRAFAAVNLLGETMKEKGQSLYAASEFNYSDSYFDSPQHFKRFNGLVKYNGQLSPKTTLSLTGSHFYSKWNHSGQIPDRAVAEGLISFFGAIDDREGGETSRTNVNAQLLTQTARGGLLRNQFYYSRYLFELYSNFTFFLNDPINGDQIRQKEARDLFGYNGSYTLVAYPGGHRSETTIGVQYRQDLTGGSELSHTKDRVETLERKQYGDINELNAGAYVDEQLQLGERWRLNAGLRFDFFRNGYRDRLQTGPYQSVTAGIVSPKLSLYYTASDRVQVYLNTGKGFHSNDTRVVVPQNGRQVLPPAYGSDLGVIWKPAPKLLVQTAFWYLGMAQEFVYVGDEGVVEPSGKSRRLGLDLTARYQLGRQLYADLDVNWARPRAVGEEAAPYLPLAPLLTSAGGLTYYAGKGFNGSVRYRYMGDRPANEDNSIVAKGYFVTDMQVNYTRPRYVIGLSVNNLFNTRWKETQFATESRLKNETAPVDEIHFTAGSPFFGRVTMTFFW
ncbi:MAG: TonB-dependent receptor [Siphonobacter aquaeclarae]|nr:TonB-dependent receptor [Siphonobacter aquaeclarae]